MENTEMVDHPIPLRDVLKGADNNSSGEASEDALAQEIERVAGTAVTETSSQARSTQPAKREPRSLLEQFNDMEKIRARLNESIHRKLIELQHQYDNRVADLNITHERHVRLLEKEHAEMLQRLRDAFEADINELKKLSEKI
jgi:hypothetical protein